MKEVDRICEKHGKDQIILIVYSAENGGYTFSLQCCISSIIRAVFPHQIGRTYSTSAAAKRAAVETLDTWTKSSRSARKRLDAFDITLCPYQLEFCFG